MSNVESQTTPPTTSTNEAERELRQLLREKKDADRLKGQQAAQAKAAKDRAEKQKDRPRPQWNEPERIRDEDDTNGTDCTDGSRYRAPPPPRADGTWVRVGHMWMRIVTVSARSRR